MAGPASSAATSALQQSISPVPPASTLDKAANTPLITASVDSQIAAARIESYFTQSQLALALSIAKSVPEGFSIYDYCVQLHRHIAQSNPERPKASLRYVDGCDFWKELYEKVHQENKALQDKVRLLEERQRVCERMPSPDSEDQTGRSTRKRPVGFEEIEEWLDDEGTDVIVPLGDDYLRLSSYTFRIFRYRHELEKVTKDPSFPDHIDNIWKSARDILGLLEAALSDCLMPLWTLKSDGESQTVRLFQQLMHQIALGFHASFEALNELVRTITGRKKRFEIVIGLVNLFQHALDYLHTLSGLQADRDNEEKRSLRNKRVRMERSEYAVNKYLSRALVQMTQMDWKTGQLGHSEILEGILCSVLTHTGHLLSHTIFNEHLAESDKPGNISLRRPISATAATKFEFRYVIPILHAALGGNTNRELIARVLGERCSVTSSNLAGHLLSNAKKLLQNTLVKSAVGADVEVLKPPTPIEEEEAYSPSVSHRMEKYGSEWFLESVWALVGWDLAV